MSNHCFCKHRTGILLSLVLLIGLAVRLDFLVASHFIIDSDEAIVGLMAKHMSEGMPPPVFYYGQHYMGVLEPFLLSLLFRIFGFVPELIKLVPLVFALLLILTMYFLGKELGGKRVGLYTALLTALPPSALIVWSGKARGGFIEIVALAAFALLMALSWYRERRFDWIRLGILSFFLGFGWWTNNQIVYVYPAIGILVLIKIFRETTPVLHRMTRFFCALCYCFFAAVLGGLPFWLYNIQNDFVSFHQLFRGRSTSLSSHALGFFENAFPILLGAKRYWQTVAVFPSSVAIGSLLFSILLIFCCVGAVRRKLSRVATLTLLGTGLTMAVVFILSPYGYLSAAPRYLLPLYVVLLPLLAGGIASIEEKHYAVGRALLVVVVAFHLSSAYLNGRAIPGEPFVFQGERVSKDQKDLIEFLQNQQIAKVRTNYWIGYRLAYETEERVTFALFGTPSQLRIPEYERNLSLDDYELLPLVLVPAEAKIVRRGLRLLGCQFLEASVSGYRVLYHLRFHPSDDVEIGNEEIQSFSTSLQHALPISRAFDNSLETRWGSAEPQKPGMRIEVHFRKPIVVTGFQYELGKWKHDYPRKLILKGLVNGEERTLFGAADFQAVVHLGRGARVTLRHPMEVSAVILLQQGRHPILDWSIAEFDIYSSRVETATHGTTTVK